MASGGREVKRGAAVELGRSALDRTPARPIEPARGRRGPKVLGGGLGLRAAQLLDERLDSCAVHEAEDARTPGALTAGSLVEMSPFWIWTQALIVVFVLAAAVIAVVKLT